MSIEPPQEPLPTPEEPGWHGVRGPFWTPANIVSLMRIPLALAAVACVVANIFWPAVVLMVSSFLTDGLDGFVARATDTVSEWGKVLDPVSDKTTFMIFGIMLVVLGRMPLWLLLVLVIRDLLVVFQGFRLLGKLGNVPASNVLGKASTVLFAAYMIRQTFWPAPRTYFGLDPIGWAALVMLVISSVAYAASHRSPPPDAEQAVPS